MPRPRIPDEIRRKVAEDFQTGLSKKKIADTYGISPTSVTRIVKEKTSAPAKAHPAPKKAPSPEMQQKLTEIERRIRDLEEKIRYFEARKQGKGTRV